VRDEKLTGAVVGAWQVYEMAGGRTYVLIWTSLLCLVARCYQKVVRGRYCTGSGCTTRHTLYTSHRGYSCISQLWQWHVDTLEKA